MRRRRGRGHRFAAEVSTASLNDIMFFLLLFFLIVSTVSNPSVIKMMLPRASKSQSLNKQSITLSVTEGKQYYLGSGKTPVNSAQLEAEIVRATTTMEEPTVVVRIHPTLSVQDLVDVLDIGNRLKIKMVLSTTQQGK